jgi:hypothetical protein
MQKSKESPPFFIFRFKRRIGKKHIKRKHRTLMIEKIGHIRKNSVRDMALS